MIRKKITIIMILVIGFFLSESNIFLSLHTNFDDKYDQTKEMISNDTRDINSTDSIRTAILKAEDGDIIQIDNGIYYEPNIVLNKRVIINGNGSENVKFIGRNASCFFKITSNYCIITNISFFYGGGGQDNAAIMIEGNNNEIKNCTFNSCPLNAISLLPLTAFNKVINCTFIHNFNTGIYCQDSTNNIFLKNNFIDNKYGIFMLTSNDNVISSNICDNNQIGFYLSNCYSNQIINNSCKTNIDFGIYLFTDEKNNNHLENNSGSIEIDKPDTTFSIPMIFKVIVIICIFIGLLFLLYLILRRNQSNKKS